MALRFLVVEGNTRGARQTHREAYGLMPSESYAAVLQDIDRDIICDLAFPADEGANLPDAAGLQSYDGIVLTGSHLSIYDRTPDILRQIDLMRAVYASGTPVFGSCWGLQIAAVAAEGDVQRNPLGREVGIARRILPTRGRGGRIRCSRAALPSMMRRRFTSTWSRHCPAIARSCPSNSVSAVQAAEIRLAGGAFWGVQYHPEFSLGELAVILGRRTEVCWCPKVFARAPMRRGPMWRNWSTSPGSRSRRSRMAPRDRRGSASIRNAERAKSPTSSTIGSSRRRAGAGGT